MRFREIILIVFLAVSGDRHVIVRASLTPLAILW